MATSEKNSKLFVGNLSSRVTRDDLFKLFEDFGKLVDVKIKDKGNSNVFAFVEYEDVRDAEKALQKLDATDFMGRDLRIEFGNGGRKRDDRGGDSRGGDRGGRNFSSYGGRDSKPYDANRGPRKCFTCGSTRHISRDCNERQNSRDRGDRGDRGDRRRKRRSNSRDSRVRRRSRSDSRSKSRNNKKKDRSDSKQRKQKSDHYDKSKKDNQKKQSKSRSRSRQKSASSLY